MLKRFFGLLCFLFFITGSGLVRLIKDFNWDVDAYYKSKLSPLVIAEFPNASEEDKPGFAEAIINLGVKGPGTFDALALLPNDLVRFFVIREATQVVVALLALYLGYRLFKSSYRMKPKLKNLDEK